MKRLPLLFLMLIVCFTGARAQETAGAADEKRRDIRRLLELIRANDLGVQIIRQSVEQLRQSLMGIPDPQREKMIKIVEEEMLKEFGDNKMTESMISVYDKRLTGGEIKELIAFYETPLGRKLVETLPEITREAYEIGAQRGREASLRAMSRLADEGLLNPPGPPPAPARRPTPRRRRN